MNLTPGQEEAIETAHAALRAAEVLTPGQPSPSSLDVEWRDSLLHVLRQIAGAFPTGGA